MVGPMTVMLVLIGVLVGGRPAAAQAPRRIVSLDYCADQYVMALADREHIAGVSPAAGSDYSYFAAQAEGLARVRPIGEAVLLAEPDLVVRQWGGGFNATAHLDRLGIPVAQIAFGNSLQTAVENLNHMGEVLGVPARAADLITQMDMRLARISAVMPPKDERPRALYLTPGGFTSGQGTFIDEVLTRAGVLNVAAEQGRKGWVAVDLERVVLDPPDILIGAFFDLDSNHVTFWSLERHAFFKSILETTPTVFIPGRQVACSAWFAVDAVETIHAFAADFTREGREPAP